MRLEKKRLKEDLSLQYGSGDIETYRKGTELDVVVEGTTPLHYCVAFDTGIIEYIDKSYFEEEIMTKELRTYLQWRCRTSWHVKYRHLIDMWIDNVLPYQCEYFEKEMRHLIDRGIYNN